ncbi:DUF4880 domain-containing protein [Pseudomonas typographi]|uniref:DUF4880 domain-containing protein n=1 Tax=Pseudomonas typographi TaxID=2715964 RepID=A0ABR7YYV5_9PSED|nr:DUF4880 domain-containing protein [Pseudomonas typographi]MBD1598396.1 DUF4880 domain-containing protein [Pseudomonas typographi]
MNTEPSTDTHVVRQAIAWWVRLRDGQAPAQLMRQCEGWRAAHPDHERAWQRIQLLDAELGHGLKAIPAARQTLEAGQRALSRRRAIQLLAGSAVIGGGLWMTRGNSGLGWASDFATATGQRQRFTLPGGAALTLNTHSTSDLLPQGVRLKQGEWLLETDKPVQLACRLGALTLAHGRMALRDAGGLAQLSLLRGRADLAGRPLREGQTLRATAAGLRLVTPELDPAAWAEGLIVTSGMPLGHFLDELGRYRRGVLKYAPEVAGLMLSGVYRVDDSDTVLHALTQTLPVQLGGLTRWWVTVEHAG